MKQLNAKKLTKLFNSFVQDQKDQDNWNAELVIEHVAPEFVGGAIRDTNGDNLDNLTVQLINKTYTTSNVLFVADSKYKSFQVYFRAHAYERNDKSCCVVVVFKNAKGQRSSFTVDQRHFGDSKARLETVRQRLGFGYENSMSDEMEVLSESISEELSFGRLSNKNIEAMASLGIKIETIMEYTNSFWINPTFLKHIKNGIIVGWMSKGAYASHPHILKILKVKHGVNLVRLYDIGAEASGYYRHHNMHTCHPKNAPALKAHAKSFLRMSKGK